MQIIGWVIGVVCLLLLAWLVWWARKSAIEMNIPKPGEGKPLSKMSRRDLKRMERLR